MDWSIFLFVMKWIFLGLVYLVLLLLLIGGAARNAHAPAPGVSLAFVGIGPAGSLFVGNQWRMRTNRRGG